MLNTNSTAATQSLNIANVLLDAHWQRGEEGASGAIFSVENFARSWDEVYVCPQNLAIGIVEKNMRKLVEPTLIITQKCAKTAFVLASEKTPVYLPCEYKQDKEYGYIMAFRLAPVIDAEYMFYMCQFDLWKRLLRKNADTNELVGWHSVGQGDTNPYTGANNRPEDLVRNIGNIELPSLASQREMVAAAKEQAQKIQALTTVSDEELKSTVESCLISSGMSNGSIFKYAKSRIGLLREIYCFSAGGNVDPKVIEALSVDAFPFNSQSISREDMTLLSQNFARVFPMLVNPSEFSWSKSAEYLQPKEVTDFIVNLAGIPADKIVYNPFAGLASYAVALPKNEIVGEEINPTTWAISQIRIFAYNANASVTNADSFGELATDKKYQVIISSPVYLIEKGREIHDIFERLYDKLTDDGKLICLVPHSFTSDSKSQAIRKRLIEEHAVVSVISLPGNIFPGTAMAQDVIFIQKGRTEDDVVMGDATGFTRFAKSSYRATTFDWEQFVNEMEDNLADFDGHVLDGDVATVVKYSDLVGTNLSPEIYLTPKPKDGKPLSDMATAIKESREDGTADCFIVGSSLPEALHRKPYVPQNETEKKSSSKKNQVTIDGDAVLISIVSGNIRSVYVEDFHGTISFPYGFIKVLSPVAGVSAKYLAALVSTKIVADQIKAQTIGLTIPRLNKLDLTQVIVPDYKTDEEKQKFIAEVLSSEMSDLESELNETLEKHKREVRSTRHAMVQTLSSLSSNWEQLKRFANKRGGQINFADIVGRVNPISVEKLLGSIEHAISTLGDQVESLRFEKADWGADVEINPYGFIEDYISTHSSPNVKMVNVGSDNVADIPDMNEVTGEVTYYHTDAMNIFYAPKRLLERIFNNIVANAKAHGFSSDSKDHEIRFDWQDVNGDIVITIANNGLPLKEGVTEEDVFMSGFSTALNEDSAEGGHHFGQGGFEIKSLMEKVGSAEIISEPDAEFPVIYKLTFTNTNTVKIL